MGVNTHLKNNIKYNIIQAISETESLLSLREKQRNSNDLKAKGKGSGLGLGGGEGGMYILYIIQYSLYTVHHINVCVLYVYVGAVIIIYCLFVSSSRTHFIKFDTCTLIISIFAFCILYSVFCILYSVFEFCDYFIV